MERDFKGIWVPKEIWLDENLTALDKVILVEIDSLDSEEYGACIASNDYLAEFCQCSVSKVASSISKLKDYGLIEQIEFNGRIRKLKSRLLKNKRQTSKICKADFEKINSNNITNNISDNLRNKVSKQGYDSILDERGITGKKRDAVDEYIKMRKFIKKPMTDHALELALNNLDKLASSEEEQIAILEQSISNSWQGLFPLKKAEIVSNNEKHNVAHKPSEYENFDIKEYYKGLRK